MAWVAITNNPNWQYNNSPEDPGAGSPLRALWLKQTNGIRTIGSGAGAHQVYSEVRRVGDTTNRSRGELSKSYWDAREGTLSSYAVNNFDPKLVFDFTGNVFKTGGGISTFSNSITHARAGQATMVDSDGLLKWAPHNLLPSSDAFADTSVTLWDNFGSAAGPHEEVVMSNGVTGYRFNVTNSRDFMNKTYPVVAGAEYTFKLWIDEVEASINQNLVSLFGTNTQILPSEFTSAGYYSFTYTSSTTGTNTIRVGAGNSADTTINFVCGQPHIYRSDLGGMVNNPTTSDSYVPTTSSPVYAPRVGHHVYNGSAWVNEGILHESEARTNLMTYSGDLTGADWLWSGGLIVGTVTTGSPFGTHQTISPRSSSAGTGAEQRYQIGKSITSGSTYVTSSLVKYSAGSGWFILIPYDTGQGNKRAWFDLQNGVVGTKHADVLDYGMIDYGDGWWLCWASANATSTSGGLSVEMPNGDGVRTHTATDVILIAGTQYELGSTPSSYIPTAGATVTRAAETLTVPVANLPYPTPVETTGTELITNGTFDSNTNDWTTFNSTLSVDSNRLKIVNDGIFGSATQQFTTVSNKVYLVTADLIHGGAVDGRILINEGQFGGALYNSLDAMSSFDKTYSIVFKAASHLTDIVLQNAFGTSGGLGSTGDFNFWDNVSIKEINPLALSIQMDGKITYADDGGSDRFIQWGNQGDDEIRLNLEYGGAQTGSPNFIQRAGGVIDILSDVNAYSPNINVPFNIASRHGSTFINGAHEGTALTADTTPTELPDLSSSTLSLGFDFMGTIGQFRVWDEDLTDTGIIEATEPSTEPSLQLTFDGLSTNSFTVLDWSE